MDPEAGVSRAATVGDPSPERSRRIKDRVVQTALKLVLEPIWEARFAEQSYRFRPGRGCKDALRRVEELLTTGATWVVDVELRSYVDTIPHEPLVEVVEDRVSDSGVLKLVRSYLTQGMLDGLEQWTPGQGSPQGAVISPLLSNLYLDGLDHRMAEQGYQMVRYADDLVVLCRSNEEAEAALGELTAWVETHGLTVHPEKTRLVDAAQTGGFDFLGYHFERGKKWPSRRSVRQIHDAIRAKTGRTVSGSLETSIGGINPTIRGWFGYFKHSHRTTFSGLDGWVRMRLRSILRKRRKGTGRARNPDQQRWPNAHCVSLGLFTMQAARLQAIRALAVPSR